MIQTFSDCELKELSELEFEQAKVQLAGDYLEEIRKAKKRKQELADERAEYEAAIDDLGGIDYSRPMIKTSVYVDRIPDKVERLDGYVRQFSSLENALESAIAEAEDKLMSIPGKAGYVLRLYYMLGYKWSAAFAKADVSESTGYELRKQGLIQVYDIGIPERFGLPEAV